MLARQDASAHARGPTSRPLGENAAILDISRRARADLCVSLGPRARPLGVSGNHLGPFSGPWGAMGVILSSSGPPFASFEDPLGSTVGDLGAHTGCAGVACKSDAAVAFVHRTPKNAHASQSLSQRALPWPAIMAARRKCHLRRHQRPSQVTSFRAPWDSSASGASRSGTRDPRSGVWKAQEGPP